MKFKTSSWIALLCGAVFLAAGIVAPLIVMQSVAAENGAVGIIGGADAPTYNYIISRVMHYWPVTAMLLGAALVLTGLFCLLFSKTVQLSCTFKTSAVSMALSATGGAGLVCFLVWAAATAFGEASKSPIAYPASICGGVICFALFVLLIVQYFQIRSDKFSLKGIVIDVLASMIYLPSFFFLFYYLREFLRHFV